MISSSASTHPTMSHVPRIVVIGSANTDLTTFTDQFPRPGETIFARSFQLGFGGKGANQAVAARRCRAEVAMVARVGDDLFGTSTLENFRKLGMNTDHVTVTPGVSSGVAPIFVDSEGQNRILVVKGANDLLSPADVDAAADVIRGADFVILQLEIPIETVYYALEFAQRSGVRSILNPAPAQKLDWARVVAADFVIPNETEAEMIPPGKLRHVITTLGEQGAMVEGKIVAPFTVKPVDTTGAGDAFIGSLACFLAEGLEESEAVSRANLYAALSTLSTGTQSSFVTREQFDAEWATRSRGR
jgi:ribokinase